MIYENKRNWDIYFILFTWRKYLPGSFLSRQAGSRAGQFSSYKCSVSRRSNYVLTDVLDVFLSLRTLPLWLACSTAGVAKMLSMFIVQCTAYLSLSKHLWADRCTHYGLMFIIEYAKITTFSFCVLLRSTRKILISESGTRLIIPQAS